MEIYETNGLKFYVRGDWDRYIIQDEFRGEYYRIPKDIKVAVDIGAHIGGTTMKLAQMGAEVYAYEPDDGNYEMLVKNIELNGLQDRIHAFHCGVGNPGKRTLYIMPNNTGCSSFSGDIDRVRERPLKQDGSLISIEEVFKNIEHCDFLKFDCEGGEYEFLPNLTEELANKISAMSGELHFFDHPLIVNSLKRFYKVECDPDMSQNTQNRLLFAVKK